MKKVKLIGPGLKLNNSWKWCGDIVEITDKEYEKNKNFLELLEDINEDEKNDTSKDTNDLDNNGNDSTNGNDTTGEGENTDDEDEENDEELELIRAKAKELGINPGRMKKETLLAKIKEKEENV